MVENISDGEGDMKIYSMTVKGIQWREQGGIDGHASSKVLLMKRRLNSNKGNKKIKYIKSVTHVGKWICCLSM